MSTEKKNVDYKKTIIRVLALMKPYRLRLVISLCLAVVVVVTTLALPILTGRAVDMMLGVGAVDFKGIGAIVIYMLILMAVTALTQWLMSAINNGIAYRMIRDMRVMAFDKLQKLPVSYIDSHSHGDTISRIITDVDQFSEGLLLGFAQFFTGILTILMTLVFMFVINPLVALIVLCVTPLSFFVAKFIARKSFIYFKEQSVKRGAMTAIVNEMIDGLACIKSFDAEAEACDKFNKADEELRKASLKATFYSSTVNPSTRFVNSIVYAGVAVFGAVAAVRGGISVGELTIFLSYASQYTKPFNEISGVITELQNSVACAARVFALIDEAEIPEDAPDAVELKDVDGRVDIENVSFSYTKEVPLIDDFSISVKPGQSIAIVGPTGCGKTTMINLIMRFYDVNSGSIKVEGVDIRNIKRSSLRHTYGMVLQETWLKNATIKENISMGKPDATMDEIVAAAKEAHADSFIQRLPEGYDTRITGEGSNLSAGQRQLLCIARVMLALPSILILDEATSSIDTRTELRIQEAFLKMMKGRTSFIVAHRLSTIRDADCIIVMNNGHIVEQGSHAELLEKGGFYYKLYNSQFAISKA